MNIIESNDIFKDKMQPGAFIGSTLVAAGIKNSAIIYHGYLGCNVESVHMRSDSIPNGFYTPIIATGLNESDSIYGGYEKLKQTLNQVCQKNYDLIWILTGDATSITADDIQGLANSADIPDNVKVISLDVPGFLGGIAKGTDIAVSKLLEYSECFEKKENSICIIAPHLMGIKSHPYDIDEINYLLESSGVTVDSIISKNLNVNEVKKLLQSKYFLPLTWEAMPNLEQQCNKYGIEYLNGDIPLPIGISNTENWLLSLAGKLNSLEQAKEALLKEKEVVIKQLKYNYNYSWLSTLYAEKTCSIYGYSQFAVSLALCFFYDFNIKPKVIAIIAETAKAIDKSKRMLAELSEYTDFTLLINPDYYTYVNCLKTANVDFAVGSVQDKPLCVGEGFSHVSLGGYYFFNNYNFIPWPYMGIKGTLALLTELGFLMEKTFYYEKYWKNYSYHSGS